MRKNNFSMKIVTERDPNEVEFQQAVMEVVEAVKPVMDKNLHYRKEKIIERIIEPERGFRRSHWS